MDKKGGTKIRDDKVIESQIQDKVSSHIELDEMWNRRYRLEQVQTGIRQCGITFKTNKTNVGYGLPFVK